MPEQKWMLSQALLDTLCEIVGTENVSVGEPMAAHVTFRIGGPAAVMVSPQSPEQVAEVVRACGAAEAPMRIIGLGSDLLIADGGLACVVIRSQQTVRQGRAGLWRRRSFRRCRQARCSRSWRFC